MKMILKTSAIIGSLKKIKKIKYKPPPNKKPSLYKGMLAYCVLWPTSSFIEQTLQRRKRYDWRKMATFGLYGGFFVAPTLHGWVKLTSAMWPGLGLRIGLKKVLLEQISYGPFLTCNFFLILNMLESKTWKDSVDELRVKFIPAYKAELCFWPLMQLINFGLLPEHFRVIFLSICSLLFTTFLAYMKSLDRNKLRKKRRNKGKKVNTNG